MKCIENLPSEFEAATSEEGKIITFRIFPGADLYLNLLSIAQNYQVISGDLVKLLGTLKTARIGFFNSATKKFEWADYTDENGYELASGQGTFALEKEMIKPHVHIVIAERRNNVAHAGHLCETPSDISTIVKEYVEGTIVRHEGIYAVRRYDPTIGASPVFFEKETR